MKYFLLTFVTMLVSICTFSQSLMPDVIATSGDYYTTSTIKLNWTLGETITETFIPGGKILTQGFQQSSYTASSITETNENKQISVFPNPFSDIITINTGDLKGLHFQVLDFQGRNIMEKTIEKSNKQIDFSAYASGVYFIKVFENKTLLKTFKIQKTTN